MPLQLVLFDLDGTLVDSRIDITNAINYALEEYGVGPFRIDDITSRVGSGITRLIEELLKPYPHIPLKAVIERFLYHYERHLTDNTRPYPGVKEVLEELKGYKKAVISNKLEALSKKTLEGLGLLKYFDMVIGSDTTPEKKPSPVPVLTVLNKLNVSPEEAVIVGDSDLDIEAGKSAGILTIAVTYGYRPVETLSRAEYIIDTISELPPLLKLLG